MISWGGGGGLSFFEKNKMILIFSEKNKMILIYSEKNKMFLMAGEKNKLIHCLAHTNVYKMWKKLNDRATREKN